MAKKPEDLFPHPKDVRGAVWNIPGDTKLLYGLGALFLGAAALRFSPKLAEKLIPVLVSAFTPPEAYRALPFVPYHPEGAEPIETRIDERQLGRSEVIREISNPRKN